MVVSTEINQMIMLWFYVAKIASPCTYFKVNKIVNPEVRDTTEYHLEIYNYVPDGNASCRVIWSFLCRARHRRQCVVNIPIYLPEDLPGAPKTCTESSTLLSFVLKLWVNSSSTWGSIWQNYHPLWGRWGSISAGRPTDKYLLHDVHSQLN
jgi:hypothetical protein